MTMGDRVAVIRKGVLQQADTPQFLYDHPRNLFVAGFIGSPAMNMVDADLTRTNGSGAVGFGGLRLEIPDRVFADRPELEGFVGKRVILGIRPEDIEDATLVSDAPDGRRIRATVSLREALGAEVLVHFAVSAPPVLTDDTRELAGDIGQEILQTTEANARTGSSIFLARLTPSTSAREGDPIELAVNVNRLHFFDPQTGLGIYGG